MLVERGQKSPCHPRRPAGLSNLRANKFYACYKKNVCVTGHRFNTSGGLNTD